MAKVRARPDNRLLFMDFYYRGVRCREQTALPDTAQNRRRVQSLLSRIEKEIKQGLFDYAATFPCSAKAQQFAMPVVAPANTSAAASAVGSAVAAAPPVVTPTVAEFSVTWRSEMARQWRRLHRMSVDAIFKAHLLPTFGDKALSVITKADVLAFRAELAKLPGRGRDTLSPATTNKIFGILRQCLMEASDRFGLSDVFRGVRRLKARRPDVQPFSLEEVEKIRATRHTTATLMLAPGENSEWIARLMGHANTQMLFTVYSRFVPNLTRQDGLAITGFLASRTEAQGRQAHHGHRPARTQPPPTRSHGAEAHRQ